jgi:hypothetical protein
LQTQHDRGYGCFTHPAFGSSAGGEAISYLVGKLKEKDSRYNE